MTNITLSIEDSIYTQMRKYSEIKWSEFVRKCIQKRIKELNKLNIEDQESIISMIASEEILKKEWDNDFDNRWDNV